MTRLVEQWVVVSAIEVMLRPKKAREFAILEKATGSWKGWTSPGYRDQGPRTTDWFPSLLEAFALVRQVRDKYPHATAVCLVHLVPHVCRA